MFPEGSFFRRHKIITFLGFLLLVLILVPMLFLWSRGRGPYPDYALDLTLPAPGEPAPAGELQVGVAKRDITPNLDAYDSWTDVNNNCKYDEGVDTYVDKNGNGKFDGVWIAGFGTNRPAKGVNDPQWVRAIAFRNNGVTLVMATFDAIGIFHNDFVAVRKSLDPALKIDHVAFSSTHCHEVADTMRMWSYGFTAFGEDIPFFGFDHKHMAFIRQMAREAIEEAVRNLAPADMYCASVAVPEEGFIRDSRKPKVMDTAMYLMRFTKPGTDDTIATFVNWGNHPESLGGDNPLLTSDFPHWLREGIEHGVPEPNGVEGLGGMCLYFQGMVGGLMTQLGVSVPHRDEQRTFKEDSFEKAEALGQNLAILACKALRGDQVWKNEKPRIAVAAKTFYAPMQGLFRWAIQLGLMHQGYYGQGRAKSESNALRIGDVVILTVPGEIYPEIVQGGIEALPGRDFEIAPVETPPLRTAMQQHAKMAFVVGLANDEIGYIIPKSQWDAKAPFVYDGRDQYGEENSPGPDVAGVLHQASSEMLERINATFSDGQ